MMHRCVRCGRKIKEKGIGNRIKIVGKEGYWSWIFRHIRQLFSLIRHGFIKPQTEGFVELCDECFEGFKLVFSVWMRTTMEDVQRYFNRR